MVVIGGIVGAGIFINPYLVAQKLGSSQQVIAAWIAGGAIALLGALAFAELGARLPQAGGQYVYLREVYHPLVAFLFSWASLLMIQGGGMAAVAITFGQYAQRLAGGRGELALPIAVAAVVLLALINCLGVSLGSRLLNLLVLLKVAALALLIGAGIWAGAAVGPVASTEVEAPPALGAFGAALIPILFAYGGWQGVNTLAEETREPARNLPIGLCAGTLVVIAIYVAVNLVYLHALGRAGLAATMTPAADAVERLLGVGADRAIAAAIAISTFGFLDLTLLAYTRIYFASARDGWFPPPLARLHPRYGSPNLAILAQAGWSVVLISTGSYAELVDAVVFADWIFFGLAVAGLSVLRGRDRGRPAGGEFRMPGYPWTMLMFVAAAVAVVVSVVIENPKRSAAGAALLACGIPVYAWFARRRGKSPPAPFSKGGRSTPRFV
jgi:APA family basic amino acid/polyamine antiporter